jgi:hypothetical protein
MQRLPLKQIEATASQSAQNTLRHPAGMLGMVARIRSNGRRHDTDHALVCVLIVTRHGLDPSESQHRFNSQSGGCGTASRGSIRTHEIDNRSPMLANAKYGGLDAFGCEEAEEIQRGHHLRPPFGGFGYRFGDVLDCFCASDLGLSSASAGRILKIG